MFLIHVIQREEESLVIDCQQYCLEHLVNRIYEPEPLPEGMIAAGRRRAAGGDRRQPAGEGRDEAACGLELNATSPAAVDGRAGRITRRRSPLEPDEHELPLVINLEKSAPVVGRAGPAVARDKPHLICRGFLPHVGDAGPQAGAGSVGRHKLDADAALGLVWQRLHAVCKTAGQVVATLPGYLSRAQADVVRQLAPRRRCRSVGTLSRRWRPP